MLNPLSFHKFRKKKTLENKNIGTRDGWNIFYILSFTFDFAWYSIGGRSVGNASMISLSIEWLLEGVSGKLSD